MIISFSLKLEIIHILCRLHVLFQFYRSFPGPPDVSESEMNMLVQKYRDPERPGLLNYLNLHHDIVAIGDQMSRERELIEGPGTHVDEAPVIVSGKT